MMTMLLFALFLIGINAAAEETAPPNPRLEIYNQMTSGEKAFLVTNESPIPAKTGIPTDEAWHKQVPSRSRIDVDRMSLELRPLAEAHGITAAQISRSKSEIQHLIENAEQGSADAAYFLGLFHLYGLESLTQDEKIALEWFRRSSDQAHDDASCAVGLMLFHGHGKILVDKATAASYFRRAAENGHAYAQWLYGRSLYDEATSTYRESKESNTFTDLMKEAADSFGRSADEIPEAAHQLAVMLEYGLGPSDYDVSMSTIPQSTTPISNNFMKAVRLYEHAARKGHAESMYNLGLIFTYGRDGIEPDYLRASELFKRAATHPHQPHVPSMRYFAIMLSHGYANSKGIPDYDAAISFYEMCIDAKHNYLSNVKDLCISEHRVLSDVVYTAREMALQIKEGDDSDSDVGFIHTV